MNNQFAADEKLYRAVLPLDMFWKKNGKVSSAAFYDPKGLSVERGYYRDDIEVSKIMHERFRGNIVYNFVEHCNSVNALVKYLPSHNSVYHSEIHKDNDTKLLTESQRKHLAKNAIIIEE